MTEHLTEHFHLTITNLRAMYPSTEVTATGRPRGGITVYMRDDEGDLVCADFPGERCAIKFLFGWLQAEGARIAAGLERL